MTTFTSEDRIGAQFTPLTHEKIKELYIKSHNNLIESWENGENNIFKITFAREIERAHGIGG
jgi:hypothetical protein